MQRDSKGSCDAAPIGGNYPFNPCKLTTFSSTSHLCTKLVHARHHFFRASRAVIDNIYTTHPRSCALLHLTTNCSSLHVNNTLSTAQIANCEPAVVASHWRSCCLIASAQYSKSSTTYSTVASLPALTQRHPHSPSVGYLIRRHAASIAQSCASPGGRTRTRAGACASCI